MLRSDRVLILNGGYGLLVWPAFKATPEGLVVAQVPSTEEKEYLEHSASALDELSRPRIFQGSPSEVLSVLEEGLRFEFVVGRNMTSTSPPPSLLTDGQKPKQFFRFYPS